jgi:glycine cleavage system protein P-like pyridoxal-binding family
MAREKIKLEEKAISEVLIADTDSESVAEVMDVKDCFEEEEEEEKNNNNNNSSSSKPQQNSNHKLQQVADYQTWGPNQRTQIYIFLSVQQKV